MENRGNRTGEELARTKAKLYGFPSSPRSTRNAPSKTLTQPSVQIGFEGDLAEFQPGDFLRCEYRVSELPDQPIQAIETSVIWLTDGKGDSDIGVHCFERRQKQALTNDTFKSPQRISTVLPASPLSYEGKILKIRWCVRVRLFLSEGAQVTEDQFFQLGRVKRFSEDQLVIDSPTSTEVESPEHSESGPAPDPA